MTVAHLSMKMFNRTSADVNLTLDPSEKQHINLPTEEEPILYMIEMLNFVNVSSWRYIQPHL